jgi:hypothetical protein
MKITAYVSIKQKQVHYYVSIRGRHSNSWNDKGLLMDIKAWLSSVFEMKDMGEAAYILWVKISRDRSKKLLSLSQETYIKKILERFYMQGCKSIDTPTSKSDALCLKNVSQRPKVKKRLWKKVPNSSTVDSLMHTIVCIRPDICFAVRMVKRTNPTRGKNTGKRLKR